MISLNVSIHSKTSNTTNTPGLQKGKLKHRKLSGLCTSSSSFSLAEGEASAKALGQE